MTENPIVHVLPAGIDVEIAHGARLMRAAQGQGMRWPNACNGQAQCGLCFVEVTDGDLSAIPPSVAEAQMLARIPQTPRMGGVLRLACQLSPTTNLIVHKLGVRAPAQ